MHQNAFPFSKVLSHEFKFSWYIYTISKLIAEHPQKLIQVYLCGINPLMPSGNKKVTNVTFQGSN